MKLWPYASVLAVLAYAMLGCSRDTGDGSSPIRSVADLKGRRCGVVTGSAMQEAVEAVQQGVEFCSFNDALSMVEALRLGKVDAVPLDTVVLRRWAANRPGELEVVARFANNPFGFLFFPIITTAFIYFVASWLLAFALERAGRRLDPASGREGGVT